MRARKQQKLHVYIGVAISTAAAPRRKQETLRNLGVEESLIKLPPAPNADPEALPGMVRMLRDQPGRAGGARDREVQWPMPWIALVWGAVGQPCSI